MEMDFSAFSLAQLNELYEQATADMNAALLDGAVWETLRDKRMLVTQLSIQIAKKKLEHGLESPADPSLKMEDG
jgi:hypothetical protein